jgi:hypothetical protein
MKLADESKGFDSRTALLEHIHHISDQISSTILRASAVLAVVVAISSVVAVRTQSDLALLVAPVVAINALSYVIHLFTEASMRGGYQAYLEERLERKTGESIAMWELVLAPIRKKAKGTRWANRTWGFLTIGGWVAAAIALVRRGNYVCFSASLLLGGLALVGFFFSYKEWSEAFNLGRDSVRKHAGALQSGADDQAR